MNMRILRRQGPRSGFTLPEVLVAVAMVGVLSAVVLPTVVGQISKGDVSRVVQDMQNVEQAAQMFRTDVGSWPRTLSNLVTKPTGTAKDSLSLDGTVYGTGIDAFKGPYLARGSMAATGLPTGLGGSVKRFSSRSWGGSTFVVIEVDSLSTDEANLIDAAVDDGATVELSLTDDAAGKVRYATTTSTLYYFTSPLK